MHACACAGSCKEDGDASLPSAAGISKTLPDAVGGVSKPPIYGGKPEPWPPAATRPGNARSLRLTGTRRNGAGGGGKGLRDSGINAWV